MFKAVIFDFDYTLGDSTKGIALSINYGLERLGHAACGQEEIRKTIGLSLKDTYALLAGRTDEQKAKQFAAFFQERADQVMVDHTQLYPGVMEVLQKLRTDGCRTGIVTTKFHYRIQQILSKFNATHLIDLIVGAEDVKFEKPDPEGLLWAIGKLGIHRDEVLYVGDSLVDAKTATNAKVPFAAVLAGTTARESFEDYDHVLIAEAVTEVYRQFFHEMSRENRDIWLR